MNHELLNSPSKDKLGIMSISMYKQIREKIQELRQTPKNNACYRKQSKSFREEALRVARAVFVAVLRLGLHRNEELKS